MPPEDRPIQVLLVEDDPHDYELFRAQFSEIPNRQYVLEWARGYEEGLAAIQRRCHDVCLVDQRLGPASGVDLIRQAVASGCKVPLIMLTGQHRYQVDLEAMQSGASDYLLKEEVAPPLLERAVRYAIERQRMQAELERQRELQEQARELRSLDALSGPERMAVTAQTFGMQPLRLALPSMFETLAREVEEVLEQSLAEQAFRIRQTASARLRDLGERLGSLGCGPRDVIDLYTAAIRTRIAAATPVRAKAYLEEGRIMALELMGNLASWYRRLCRTQGLVSPAGTAGKEEAGV